MISKLKYLLGGALVFVLTGWAGTSIFSYVTHKTPPQVTLNNFEPEQAYAHKLVCTLTSKSSYKVGTINVMLDDQEIDFGQSKQIGLATFELPLTIDLEHIENGTHTLKVEATDSSYNKNKQLLEHTFTVDNTPLKAAFLDDDYVVSQGHTLHVKLQANKKLKQAHVVMLDKEYEMYPESESSTLYECFVPIDCEEHPAETLAHAKLQDAVSNEIKPSCKVKVRPYEFKKQRGFTVEREKLDHEKEISMNSKILREAINKWIQDSPKKKMWNGPFEYPIEVKRITTPFGEVRTTPERGRYHHKGLDLINTPRSVVWASQHGKVIIKDRFLLTGNTVVLDHGLGVFTLYAHLDDFAEVEVGEIVKKGNPIGKLGMTGYASGYHLHWELIVKNTQVDPTEWTKSIY